MEEEDYGDENDGGDYGAGSDGGPSNPLPA